MSPRAAQAPASSLVISLEEITPDMAEEIMETNVEHNRHIKYAQVERYARDMAAGKWLDNGETVKIDTDGRLIDGQHRMLAIVEAGVTVKLWVARGLAPEAIGSVDIGTSRKYSDLLKLGGETNVMQLGAFLRRLYLWERGIRVKKGTLSPSPAEMNVVLENNRELVQLAMARGSDTRQQFKPITPSVGAMAFFLFARIDYNQAMEFFDRLADGGIADTGHPISRLRHRLINTSRTLSTDEKLALLVRTWNHYREGNSVDVIPIAQRGQLSNSNFPEPK